MLLKETPLGDIEIVSITLTSFKSLTCLISYNLKRETLHASGVNSEVKQQERKRVKYTKPNNKERELTIPRVPGSLSTAVNGKTQFSGNPDLAI